MADNTTLNSTSGGDTIRDKDRTGVKTQIVGLDLNPAGSEVLGTGDATNGLDVDVTRVQGTVAVSGPLTDTQIRATALPVSGTVSVASAPTTAVTGPLTDTQLRASAVPVSGTVTASGPLTDTQLRATAVSTMDQAVTTTTGTISALNGTVQATVPAGDVEWTATFSGTFTGTSVITFEGSPDGGTNWFGTPAVARNTTTPLAVTTLSAAQFGFGVVVLSGGSHGWTHVRAKATTFQAADSIGVRLTLSPRTTLALPAASYTIANMSSASNLSDAMATPSAGAIGAFGANWNGTTWDRTKGNTTIGTQVGHVPASLVISSTAAISTAVTATLPAAAGLFHYITRINISKYAGVAVTGAAAPVVVTTTNLPGSLAFQTPTAMAVGTQFDNDVEPANPIKSSVVNTATTIVAPLTTSVIWRINVYYYTAP